MVFESTLFGTNAVHKVAVNTILSDFFQLLNRDSDKINVNVHGQ